MSRYIWGRTDEVRPGRHEKGNGLNSAGDTYWAEGDANLSVFSEVRRGALSIFAAINKKTDTVLSGPVGSSQPLRPSGLM